MADNSLFDFNLLNDDAEDDLMNLDFTQESVNITIDSLHMDEQSTSVLAHDQLVPLEVAPDMVKSAGGIDTINHQSTLASVTATVQLAQRRQSLAPLNHSTFPPPVIDLPLPTVIPVRVTAVETLVQPSKPREAVARPVHLLPANHPSHPKLSKLPSLRDDRIASTSTSTTVSSSYISSNSSTRTRPSISTTSYSPLLPSTSTSSISSRRTTIISTSQQSQSTPRVTTDDMFSRRTRDSYLFQSGIDLSDLGAEFDIPSILSPAVSHIETTVSESMRGDNVGGPREGTQMMAPPSSTLLDSQTSYANEGLRAEDTRLTSNLSANVMDGERSINRRASRVFHPSPVASTSTLPPVLVSTAAPVHVLSASIISDTISLHSRRASRGFESISNDQLPRRASRAFTPAFSIDDHSIIPPVSLADAMPSLPLLPPPPAARPISTRPSSVQPIPLSRPLSHSTSRPILTSSVASRVPVGPTLTKSASISAQPPLPIAHKLTSGPAGPTLTMPKGFSFGAARTGGVSREETRRKRAEEREKEVEGQKREMKRGSAWGASSTTQTERDKRIKLTSSEGQTSSGLHSQVAPAALTLQALTQSGKNATVGRKEVRRRVSIFLDGVVDENTIAPPVARTVLVDTGRGNQLSKGIVTTHVLKPLPSLAQLKPVIRDFQSRPDLNLPVSLPPLARPLRKVASYPVLSQPIPSIAPSFLKTDKRRIEREEWSNRQRERDAQMEQIRSQERSRAEEADRIALKALRASLNVVVHPVPDFYGRGRLR